MIRPIAIRHGSFTVRNVEQSLRFYRDVLGMEVLVDQAPDAEHLGHMVG